MAKPISILEIRLDRFTGRPKMARVCSWCEKENKETKILDSFLRAHNHGESVAITHTICHDHYAKELQKLKID